jgi:hypothetical protein
MKRVPASGWAVIAIALAVLAYRVRTLDANELSWDVFGYYLPLPATFVHADPLLTDIGWVRALLQVRPISGTLYQVTAAPDGSPMYFFLLGMALLYLPFFLLACAVAAATGHPIDGFSPPFQSVIAVGFTVYTAIALVHWRRVLRTFFPERTTALVLLLVAFGTNWFHFMTVKNLETANALFMLMAVLVWNTLEWHRSQRRRNLLWIAAALALIALVKPSEVLAGLIPLLWGVHDRASLRAKHELLKAHRADLQPAVALGLLLVLPQMIYWTIKTGLPLYDSYRNPGVGLDLFAPHIGDVLFSYRKGWLVYTPLMLLALVGFVPLRRRHPQVFPAIAIWCGVAFWIIASWTEWWYGASYSVRPMITLYVLLSIPFGLALQVIAGRPLPIRIGAGTAIVALVVLNLFQMWQHHAGILDPYRTTKAYYWAIFGRTSVPEGAERLKSVERPFTEEHTFDDRDAYRPLEVDRLTFEPPFAGYADRLVLDSLAGGIVLRMDGSLRYSPSIRARYQVLTNADHAWVGVKVRMRLPEGAQGEPPLLVFAVERREGPYGYRTKGPADPDATDWQEVVFEMMVPPIRSGRDELHGYVWRRGQGPVLVDDLEMILYVPKTGP